MEPVRDSEKNATSFAKEIVSTGIATDLGSAATPFLAGSSAAFKPELQQATSSTQQGFNNNNTIQRVTAGEIGRGLLLSLGILSVIGTIPIFRHLYNHGRVHTLLWLLNFIEDHPLTNTLDELVQVNTAAPATSAYDLLILGEIRAGIGVAGMSHIAQNKRAARPMRDCVTLANTAVTLSAQEVVALLNLNLATSTATFAAQVAAIAGNNGTHLLNLYRAGANEGHINTLLPLINDGNVLLTYLPIILRQHAEGFAINAQMITRVERQVGTVTKLEEIESANGGENLEWEPQDGGDLVGTAFGRWLLANGPRPNTHGGEMNCWEVTMFGAYQAGFVDFQWLQDFYTDFRTNNFTQPPDPRFFENRLRQGNDYVFTANPNSPRPLRGDIVTFGTAENHTAIALGNTGGSPQVLSLWEQPGNNDYLQSTTVGTILSLYPPQAQPVVTFFSPNWV